MDGAGGNAICCAHRLERARAPPPSKDPAMPHDDRAAAHDPLTIYRLLKRGLGHELVTDDNVDALIALAERNGHQLLLQALCEWRAPCSDGSNGVPSTIAPTRGFNREHAKH